MKKEWISNYIRNLDKLKEINLKNSNRTGESLPRYILKKEFFVEYTNYLDELFKDISINPYLKFSNYQEFRIVSLINCLNKAKQKYMSNKGGVEAEDYEMGMKVDMENDRHENLAGRVNTSQIKLVNNVIKNSFELTSYIYLLEWLQSIYLRDDPLRSVMNERFTHFDNTTKNIISNSREGKEMHFHPDLLNNQSEVIHSEDVEKFNKLIELIVFLIRQGKLEEAQKMAESSNQPFVSSMLNGGLPMNDFILDKFESNEDIDYDLLLPFMKTKELTQIKNNLKHFAVRNTECMDVINSPDQVVGNPNWVIWFYSIFDACENNQNFNHNDKISWQIKVLQSYLSGNPSFIEKNKFNIYDSLYTNILSIVNLRVIQEYSNVDNLLSYHYVDLEEPDFSKSFNRLVKGKNVIDVINNIKSKEKFKEAVKQDYLVDVEFEIVQLYFIDNTRNSQLYYQRLDKLLTNIINTFYNSVDFEEYLRTHNSVIENSIYPKSDMRFSQSESQQKNESSIKLIKLNYLKVLFNTLTTFYATNLNKFEIDEETTNEVKTMIKNIYNNYDVIISMYFEELSELILRSNVKHKPEYLVYVLGFCLNMDSVQTNLTSLAQKLKDYGAENYKVLVREIDIHFREFQETLNTNIANDTHIYLLPANISSVDEILQNDLQNKFIISGEDEIKINQIKFLFSDGKIEKITILKFMLKLTLRFLSNNKFHEALTLEKQFEDSLDIRYILGENFTKDNKFDRDDLNFIFFLENNIQLSENLSQVLSSNNLDIFHIGIYYTILFTKFVLDCYFDYLNLAEHVFKELKINNPNSHFQTQLNNKSKDLIKKFKNLIRLIRILVADKHIEDVLLNFFGEEVFLNDITVIISKWIFQILKWTVQLYTQETFKAFNLMSDDGVELIVDLLTVKDDILLKNYVLDNNDTFIETERTFFRYLDSSHERRKEVFNFIYQLGKSNRNLLDEVLDDALHSQLNKEIENYEFL